jgi:hypothetical protein
MEERMKKNRIVVVGVLLIITGIFSGCAGSSKFMKPATGGTDLTVAKDNESIVVFMRPSGLGFAVSSSVFDLGGNDEKFVAIVSAKKKVAYRTNPGKHVFMVIGESADFMNADLQAGKTYYARVTPRMGAWKARFSLKPVSKGELISSEFKEWFNTCELTENTPEAFEWARNNASSIRSKRTEYWDKWDQRTDKPSLNSDDCP